MLGKLIKHDFRALSRTLFPLQIGILGGGLVATLLSALSIRLSEGSWAAAHGSSLLQGLILSISILTAVLIGVAIMASLFVTLILICYHFYRSFLSDEGYLTFTLPVSTSNLLWSKLFTGMFWVMINAVVVMIALLIYSVFGTTSNTLVNAEVLNGFRFFFTELLPQAKEYVSVPLVIVESVVLGIVGLAAQLLQIFFAIIIGGQVAKKHRILAAIGMYLLINMGVGIVSSVFLSVVSLGEFMVPMTLTGGAEIGTFMTNTFGWYGLLSVGLCALFFLVSRSILRKNLNLQ